MPCLRKSGLTIHPGSKGHNASSKLCSSRGRPGAVREALADLLPTLDMMYEDLWRCIDAEEAHDKLETLCFSSRPFNFDDVCELLRITPTLRKLDESKCLADLKDVLSIRGIPLSYQTLTENCCSGVKNQHFAVNLPSPLLGLEKYTSRLVSTRAIHLQPSSSSPATLSDVSPYFVRICSFRISIITEKKALIIENYAIHHDADQTSHKCCDFHQYTSRSRSEAV